jgi:uncharacterized RDD family membrane protein YckC
MRILDGLMHAAGMAIFYKAFGAQWTIIWIGFSMGLISHRVGQDKPEE